MNAIILMAKSNYHINYLIGSDIYIVKAFMNL